MEDPTVHMVRIGAPGNPEPSTVVPRDFKQKVPDALPVPMKKKHRTRDLQFNRGCCASREVLCGTAPIQMQIASAGQGVAPAVKFCVELRQSKCKLPV